MATRREISDNVIIQAFNKWSDKKWFQVLFAIIVIMLAISPVMNPLLTNYLNNKSTKESITATLDQREEIKTEKHRSEFEASMQTYAAAKKIMSNYITPTSCEYLFMLEYHNGNENVMTGIQFCRFDITLEAIDDDVDYVPLEKFHDDIVARYDILLNNDAQNKILYCSKDEFKKIDKYLATQLEFVDAESFVFVNLKDTEGKIFGSLLGVSNDSIINTTEIISCARELESTFTQNKTIQK